MSFKAQMDLFSKNTPNKQTSKKRENCMKIENVYIYNKK
jgi:hypothetical protein